MYPATTSKVRGGQHSLIKSENEYFEDWILPSYGESKNTCGEVSAKIFCPSCGEYKHELRRRCFRAACPVCYKSWLARETKVATERLFQAFYLLRKESKKHLLHHVVWSVPPDEYHLSYEEQRKRFHYRRKVAGSIAGLVIYHPWRFRAKDDHRMIAWKHCSLNPDAESPVVDAYAVYEPHFHTLSVGYLMPSNEFANRFGWIYKKLHFATPVWTARDMRGIIWYQLSHAGISPKFHTLSWFGKFSNNQLIVVKEEIQYKDMECPDCGCILEKQVFSHLQMKYVKISDWVLKITKRHYKFKAG